MLSERHQRFPRSKRIRRRAEFQRIYSRGVRVAGRHMVVFAMPSQGGGRLGVTATRKIGGAVIRARAKRRLRELYRRRAGTTAATSVDLVVNARRDCALVPWDALVGDFDECLSRVAKRMNAERR